MKRAWLALVLTSCATAEEPVRRRETIDEAIRDGVAYLVKSQSPDGSWGEGRETKGIEIYSMVPGSHDAFRVAVTALAVMALREAGETEAHARGVEYLATKGRARRDDGTILYNVWANIYALQALAIEMRTNGDPRIRAMAQWHLDYLKRYETVMGGWFYYDFEAHTQNPSEGPASFSTAAGLVALWEAKASGLAVPEDMIQRAVRCLEKMWLPGGNYLYGWYLRMHPRMDINQVQGSVCRNQSGNHALWLWGSKRVGPAEARVGLDQLVDEKVHRYAEIGRKRPYPHEAFYATSGYFFYFGHYYGALVLEKLGDRAYAPKLAEWVLPLQEADGSWWDYAMWDYHKPYGTAYAVMILLRCRG